MQQKELSLATRLAQLAHYLDAETGAVVPSIQPSTTFARDKHYQLPSNYKYSRYDNPTNKPAEHLLADLDHGHEALLFASGLAAATAVFDTLESGQHIVAPQVMYHGLQDWLRHISSKRHIGLTFYDPLDLVALEQSIQAEQTKIVWVETFLNPTWDVIDIAATAEIVHQYGAILAVDATVTPPVTIRPLDLGADIVFHSATKYLNGHSDMTGGVLITGSLDERWEDIKMIRKLTGGVLGSFEAWLLTRGLRTLAVRYQRCSETAVKIARFLKNHPAVENVLYPGLETHPGHQTARKQLFGGFGGMLSFQVKGGSEEAIRVSTAVRLFIPATSLGGVESLIEHRASVEGPYSCVPENLLRLSVGIEEAQDLIEDIDQALHKLL